MSNLLGGKQGTAYLGTNANQPPNWTFADRDPNQYDIEDVSLGDLWLNQTTQATFVLVSLQGTGTSKGALALWVPWGAGAAGLVTLSGDGGAVVPGNAGGNIDIVSGIAGLTIVGNPGAHTITFNAAGGGGITTTLTGNTGGAVAPSAGGNIFIRSYINNISVDGNVGGFPNELKLQVAGGSATLVQAISGTTPADVPPDLLGVIGLRSAITGLTIVEDPILSTLTFTSAGGGQYAEWITADAGTNPVGPDAGGNWFFVGGNNITTTGTAAANTVTFDLTGTTNHCLQVGNATGSLTSLAAATNGQVPIGSTGADPVLATLTAGAGINITNAAGSITIAATAAPVSFTWTKVAVPTAMVAHNGYIANAAGILVFTLPAAAAIGDTFAVTGSQLTPNGWRIAQNAGQRIFFLDLLTTIGVGGYIQSDNQFETVWLVCITATPGAERFTVVSSLGNITVV